MEENKNTEVVEETKSEEQETVTMTKEELNLLLQKEGDKRVSSALKKQEQKNANAVKEAEKLARMNADEKYAYELEQREKAIEAKERELSMAENKNVASGILAEKGISLKLVDFVVDEDADTMNERIKLLDQEFKKSVKAEVEKRLAGSSPKKNLPLDEGMTQEKFNKLSMAELNKLYNENPEIFNQFK